jgi:hypothetical protein
LMVSTTVAGSAAVAASSSASSANREGNHWDGHVGIVFGVAVCIMTGFVALM